MVQIVLFLPMSFQKPCTSLKLKLEDSKSLAKIIQSFAQTKQLHLGKQLHSHLISSGYSLCTVLINHFLNLYSKCGQLNYSVKLFERMSHRNLVSWTAMVTGFSQNLRYIEAIKTFYQMRIAGANPTQFAFSSVIRASASAGLVEFGNQTHCLALKFGLGYDIFVVSNLVDMYSKCGDMVNAYKLFQEIACKDEVLWTVLIDGYAKNGPFEDALLVYKRMVDEGVSIDKFVLCSTLSACAALKVLNFGKCLHSVIVKKGFELEIFVGNALTDMYSKVGDMDSASNVFDVESECRNIVSCSSLIDGYVEMDLMENALSIFLDMHRQGVESNEFTFSSLIKACASYAALDQGTQLHAQVIKFNFDVSPYVSSGLVDMYGKCGLLDDSIQVFDEIQNDTEVSWNAMLNAFAQHGLGKHAIETFNMMKNEGVEPNAITFVSLLKGCSHSGLVEEGLRIFYDMEDTYGVVPAEEHYTCVIDLLGRAGRLKEAEDFINKMPFEPNAFGWCSLLGACKIHGDKERGKLAAGKLLQLEPENSGASVLLSNIYAKEQQWDDVRTLRKRMQDDNVKKQPGYSWVDVGNRTHIFSAEDSSHPQMKAISEKLDVLLDQIKKAGYIPCTDSIPLDLDVSVKERILQHHSERIAIAFALISMPSGKPIIVKKNLRVCVDCHSAIKYISKVTGRKIIVRDNVRFHHFSDGSCSCGDFW